MDVPSSPAPVAAPIGAAPVSERAQARRETLRHLVRRPAFIVGSIVVLFWVVPRSSANGSPRTIRSTTSRTAHSPPSTAHLFGTDRLGRDVLSRVMVGSRDVLIVAPLAALLGVVAGTILGLVMGYSGASSTTSSAASSRRSSPCR